MCKAFVPTNRFNWNESNEIVLYGGIAALIFFLSFLLSHTVQYDWFIMASLNSLHFQLKQLNIFHYYDLLMATNNNTRTWSSHFFLSLSLVNAYKPYSLAFLKLKIVFMVFLFIFQLILIVIHVSVRCSSKLTFISSKSFVYFLKTNRLLYATHHAISDRSEWKWIFTDKKNVFVCVWIFHCIN